MKERTMCRWYAGAVFMGLVGPVLAQGRQPVMSYGVEVGFAAEKRMLGSGSSSRIQLVILNLEVINRIGRTKRGQTERLELVNEVSLVESLRPSRRFIISVSEVVRLTAGSGQVRPFWDIGAGIGSSGLRRPQTQELNGWLQYKLQVGVGIKYRKFLVKAGLTHYSNNHTTKPNPGANLITGLVGVNF